MDINMAGREALRGMAEETLDLIAEMLTSQQWAKMLKAPLGRAAAKGEAQQQQPVECRLEQFGT